MAMEVDHLTPWNLNSDPSSFSPRPTIACNGDNIPQQRRAQSGPEPCLQTVGLYFGERHSDGTNIIEPGVILVIASKILIHVFCRVVHTGGSKRRPTDETWHATSTMLIAM